MCVFWPDSFFQPIYRLHNSVHWLTDGAMSTCGSLDALAIRAYAARLMLNAYITGIWQTAHVLFNDALICRTQRALVPHVYIYIYICIKCTCTRVRIKKLYRKTRMLQHTFLIHPSLFRNNLLRIASIQIYIIITEKITDSKYWVLDPLVAKEYRSLTNTPLAPSINLDLLIFPGDIRSTFFSVLTARSL